MKNKPKFDIQLATDDYIIIRTNRHVYELVFNVEGYPLLRRRYDLEA